MSMAFSNIDVRFHVGACDYYWGNLLGLRYALYGGSCGGGVVHGWLCSDMNNASWSTHWVIGACDTLNLWSDRCYVLVGAKAISGGLAGEFAVSLWYFDATYDVGAC